MREEKWREIAEYIRDFADSGIRDVIKGVTTDPVTGYEYIFSQIREIFIMAACGACIAFLFEVYEGIYALGRAGRKENPEKARKERNGGSTGRQRKKRRKLKISERTVRILLDFLFCAAAALIAARFWYISSCGRISFHEAAALVVGIFAGRSVFLFKNSKPVRALAVVYVIMLITAYIVIA